MPIARSVRMTRTAISPRLATRTVSNTAQHPPAGVRRERDGSGSLPGALREHLVGLVQLDQAALLDRVARRERSLGQGPQGAPLAAQHLLAALLLGHARGPCRTAKVASPHPVLRPQRPDNR